MYFEAMMDHTVGDNTCLQEGLTVHLGSSAHLIPTMLILPSICTVTSRKGAYKGCHSPTATKKKASDPAGGGTNSQSGNWQLKAYRLG